MVRDPTEYRSPRIAGIEEGRPTGGLGRSEQDE
jgi:hypothetical protein